MSWPAQHWSADWLLQEKALLPCFDWQNGLSLMSNPVTWLFIQSCCNFGLFFFLFSFFPSGQWNAINLRLFSSGQWRHCYVERALSCQGIVRKEKTRMEKIRDVSASGVQKREREERLRSIGAYGVLAGLFLGCYSYCVMRRKQWTIFSTLFLSFSFVPYLLSSCTCSLH